MTTSQTFFGAGARFWEKYPYLLSWNDTPLALFA
jgi:hypothetical protein